jgi:hypothetical protein
MLTAIADSSSFTVGPSPALVIFTIVILMAACACVITAMKGLWIWLVAGLVTSGLACLFSAFLPPKPGSLWARRIARRRTSGTA